MLTANPGLAQRSQEINEFLAHVLAVEQQVGASITLVNSLKSSCLVMIYNMVESTMTNAIQDVFDVFESQKIPFTALNRNMKTVVLGYSKKRKPEKLVGRMLEKSIDLAIACFEKGDIFSGNVDAQKVRETLEKFGVATTRKHKEDCLLKVKTARNDLAHGIKSFSDCGRDYTAKQVAEFHSKTTTFLERVLSDFDQFLNNKAYA